MKGERVQPQASDLDVAGATELEINIGFDDFRTFLKEFSANLALEGMFVEAAELEPTDTEVAFELSLSDGRSLVAGRGVVAWSHAADDNAEAAGMGIRFLDLDPGSERLVRRIVEERTKAGLGVFDLDQKVVVRRNLVSERDTVEPGTQAVSGGESSEGEIEGLRAEIEELKRQHAEEQKRWQADLEAAREAEADLNTRLGESLSRVMTISESRDELAGRLQVTEESQQRELERLKELEEQRAKLEQAVEEQMSEVTRWTEEAVAANTGREALESRQISLEEEIESERERAEKFASEVGEIQATLSEEISAKESLEQEIKEARAALEKREAEAETAETALRESLEQARTDLEESAAKVGELDKEVESLRSELGEIQGQSEAFQAEMASVRTALAQLKVRHDDMTAHAASRQEAAARVEKLIERVRDEHASLQDSLTEAHTALREVAEVEQRLADELEDMRPEIFTPPPPEADSDALLEAENEPAPSKFKSRLGGLAQRLLGSRGDDDTSDENPDEPAVEDRVSESDAEDMEVDHDDASDANSDSPEQT